MSKTVEFTCTVAVNESDYEAPMKLTISVNDPQTITSTLRKLNGKLVIGTIKDIDLGTGAGLKGKTITISSLVTDFDADSDETEVTFKVNKFSITYKEKVERDGDTIVYKVKLKFI